MASLNQVMLIGNLGSDPELRYTSSGTPTTGFRIAVNRVYNTSEGERKEETEWFNIVTWNKLAERCNDTLAKGRRVYVQGSLKTRSWIDDTQQKHYKTEVVANKVIFLDRREEQAKFPEGEGKESPPDFSSELGSELDAEDLPF